MWKMKCSCKELALSLGDMYFRSFDYFDTYLPDLVLAYHFSLFLK